MGVWYMRNPGERKMTFQEEKDKQTKYITIPFDNIYYIIFL